jgi:hypothetical protein
VDLLGLKPGPRPDLGFPGAWLYAGDIAVLHIIAGRGVPQQSAGVIDHMAFPGIGHLRPDGKGYDWIPANYTALR